MSTFSPIPQIRNGFIYQSFIHANEIDDPKKCMEEMDYETMAIETKKLLLSHYKLHPNDEPFELSEKTKQKFMESLPNHRGLPVDDWFYLGRCLAMLEPLFEYAILDLSNFKDPSAVIYLAHIKLQKKIIKNNPKLGIYDFADCYNNCGKVLKSLNGQYRCYCKATTIRWIWCGPITLDTVECNIKPQIRPPFAECYIKSFD